MARAEAQGRYVDEWELSLMWPMITYSDNDATDALWSDLGGEPGVAACLDALGVTGITPYDGPYWGTSTASATGMAALMARLAFGEIVSPVHRAAALALLVSVVPEQRWGVPAGADESGLEIVGVKDGWYPDDAGWRVNSVGKTPTALGRRGALCNRRHDELPGDAGVRHRDDRRPGVAGLRSAARRMTGWPRDG
jgi:hypothetical protein